MELLIGTFLLRPYVFGFLAAFLLAGVADLGWRRTLLFGAWVWPLAWLAEFSSTRIGVPFGLYHYTGTTRGQELFMADVPFMDCLSFTFLAYAAFCLARAALAGRRVPAPLLALIAGVLMMLLDLVIDPIAVRGDRWFLGRIFYYPHGGVYFGVPLVELRRLDGRGRHRRGRLLAVEPGLAVTGRPALLELRRFGGGRWWRARGRSRDGGLGGEAGPLTGWAASFNLWTAVCRGWIGEWVLVVPAGSVNGGC